jgi:transcriptional regulator with XRE-family HTH domain
MEDIQSRMRDLGEFIREQRSVARLSLRKLSDMAGISNPYLSQIERGLRKPSAEILQQIAKALRISAETLYVRAGILEEREGDHDLVGEILRDPTITEAQKQALIQVYVSFQHENEGLQSPEVADTAADAAVDAAHTPADAAAAVTGEEPAATTT